MVFSASLYFRKLVRTQIIAPEPRCRAESILESPVIIARDTAKLFKFYKCILNTNVLYNTLLLLTYVTQILTLLLILVLSLTHLI